MKKKQNNIAVFSDFDGTITTSDSLELVLDNFTGIEWRKIEEQVTLGRLSEKTSLQAEFNLLKTSLPEVLKFIENNVTIDPTFKSFVKFCEEYNIPLTVLSGGIDYFIKKIFSKYNLDHLKFYSNSVSVSNNFNWKITGNNLPKIKDYCNHCKSHHLKEAQKAGKKVIYVGDGNTDRCPSLNADLIFAKNSLQTYLSEHNISHYSFKNFEDIRKQLEDLCIN